MAARWTSGSCAGDSSRGAPGQPHCPGKAEKGETEPFSADRIDSASLPSPLYFPRLCGGAPKRMIRSLVPRVAVRMLWMLLTLMHSPMPLGEVEIRPIV